MVKNNLTMLITKNIFYIVMFFVIIATIFFGYARYIEPYSVKTTKINISSNISKPITIGLFADTHFSNWYSCENFNEPLKILNENHPDIILFAGDLIDDFSKFKKESGDSTDDIIEIFSKIEAPYGKYAVYGNHDYGGCAEKTFAEIMEKSGFTVLKNETLEIPELNITISGLDDAIWGNKNYNFLNDLNDNNFNLVLCHEPYAVESFSKDIPVDFITAGHTHGGQINIPFVTKNLLPHFGKKYLKGSFPLKNKRNSTLYVTTGLGMTRLPLRFRAFPEVNLITINNN